MDNKENEYKNKKRHFKNKKKNNEVVIVENETPNNVERKPKIKHRKSGFNLIEVIIIMVITSLIGLIVGSFITYVRFDDDRDVNCVGIRKDVEEFSNVYDDLVNEYYGEVNRNSLIKSAIVGMINSLNDPYAAYIDEEAAEDFKDDLSGKFVGIGIEIIMEDGGNTKVFKVHENSPASKVGFLVNDVIVKFNDTSLVGLSASEISDVIITNGKGDEVSFTVLRGDEEITFDVVTDVVEVKSVSGYIENVGDKKIGYISISTFAENTYEQFKDKYDEFSKEDVEGLVIDVRANNGGYLSAAKNIAELFLDKDMIIYQRDTKGSVENILSETKKEIDMRVVFLTDSGTASAAEILVAALKENLGTYVVGVSTYGKGTIQKLYELSDKTYIKFTVQKWLTPRGNNINEIGIAPTYYVTLDDKYYEIPTVDNDNQLQTAFSLFE